jgi:hypothetical protein
MVVTRQVSQKPPASATNFAVAQPASQAFAGCRPARNWAHFSFWGAALL